MRVLFVSFEYPPMITGGVGTYAESLVRGLEERGIDVYTITNGGIETCDQKYGLFAPNASHWQRFHFTKRALGLSRFGEFDLVHFNGLYPIIRSPKLPTVCTIHSSRFARLKAILQASGKWRTVEDIMDLVLKQPTLCLFNTLMIRAVDKVICPSPSLVRELSYHFVDDRKIHVIPNGIDLKRFDGIEASDNDLSKKYPIEKENFILYVGRLAPIKGVEYLIQAFRSIKKRLTRLKLVIAGTGEYEPYLRSFARGIEDVLFVGFVSVSAQKFLYENSLAIAVPSLHETFPFVPLEGMACGKPIVATDVGGVRLMVRHGINGFLARPRNSTDLAKFIALLCQNPDLRRKMGKSGRGIVEREFTAGKMASDTLEVYKLLS